MYFDILFSASMNTTFIVNIITIFVHHCHPYYHHNFCDHHHFCVIIMARVQMPEDTISSSCSIYVTKHSPKLFHENTINKPFGRNWNFKIPFLYRWDPASILTSAHGKSLVCVIVLACVEVCWPVFSVAEGSRNIGL